MLNNFDFFRLMFCYWMLHGFCFKFLEEIFLKRLYSVSYESINLLKTIFWDGIRTETIHLFIDRWKSVLYYCTFKVATNLYYYLIWLFLNLMLSLRFSVLTVKPSKELSKLSFTIYTILELSMNSYISLCILLSCLTLLWRYWKCY